VLDGFTITGGYANSSPTYDAGGGIYIINGSPTIRNVILSGNYAKNGAGMYGEGSSPALSQVIFRGNTASSAGGGLYNNNSSSPTLTNVLFSGNSASSAGGGLYNGASSNPTLTNVTFSGNSATTGSGIRNFNSSVTLKNAILWDLTTPEIANYGSSSANVTYSDVQGGYTGTGAGTGIINQDPLFVDADGPDNTWGTADDDPRLGFGSPAIDVGTNSGCPSTDLDGLPSPNDGDADGTATCDMGAYEAGEMVCSVSQGSTYTFANQSGVSIQITTLGPNLVCLYVDEMEISHPNATTGIQTGCYWLIRGLQSDKTTDATGFTVTLTLPVSFTPDANDKVCRYTGSGQVWDCAQSSFDAGGKTVTRAGVNGFSDWAAGNNVGNEGGPTAVTLSSFTACSADGTAYTGLLLIALLLLASGLVLHRLRRA
jgi:hypothetical protein